LALDAAETESADWAKSPPAIRTAAIVANMILFISVLSFQKE
jgi:hypothetical protein